MLFIFNVKEPKHIYSYYTFSTNCCGHKFENDASERNFAIFVKQVLGFTISKDEINLAFFIVMTL
jgi:hypothetical protein